MGVAGSPFNNGKCNDGGCSYDSRSWKATSQNGQDHLDGGKRTEPSPPLPYMGRIRTGRYDDTYVHRLKSLPPWSIARSPSSYTHSCVATPAYFPPPPPPLHIPWCPSSYSPKSEYIVRCIDILRSTFLSFPILFEYQITVDIRHHARFNILSIRQATSLSESGDLCAFCVIFKVLAGYGQ